MNSRKVYYVWDDNLINQCDRLPAVTGRASMVHDLIYSYGLTKYLKVVRSSRAEYEDLRKFHSEMYVDYLLKIKEVDEEYITTAEDEEHGIGYDCPPVSNMYELVSTLAGGSITAAKCLNLGLAEIAINWCGGWHHAQRFGADGFCYVNDIVLAIETLKQKFERVLYIDFDVHHGNITPLYGIIGIWDNKCNGVQDAYNLSKSVFTLSIHKYEPGFYPGTGGLEDIGALAGKGYSCNIPLNAWYSDETIEYIFGEIFPEIYCKFKPDAIVLQCGADALAHDPQGGAKLTALGYHSCLRNILEKHKPTLLLGGGGYKFSNAARLWTSITALVVGESLDENIPEHEHWTKYGPNYSLAIEPMLIKDSNKKDYLDKCICLIKENLKKYVDHETKEGPVWKKKKTDLEDKQICDKKRGTESVLKIFKDNIRKENDKATIPTDVYEFVD